MSTAYKTGGHSESQLEALASFVEDTTENSEQMTKECDQNESNRVDYWLVIVNVSRPGELIRRIIFVSRASGDALIIDPGERVDLNAQLLQLLLLYIAYAAAHLRYDLYSGLVQSTLTTRRIHQRLAGHQPTLSIVPAQRFNTPDESRFFCKLQSCSVHRVGCGIARTCARIPD